MIFANCVAKTMVRYYVGEENISQGHLLFIAFNYHLKHINCDTKHTQLEAAKIIQCCEHYLIMEYGSSYSKLLSRRVI